VGAACSVRLQRTPRRDTATVDLAKPLILKVHELVSIGGQAGERVNKQNATGSEFYRAACCVN